MPLGILQRNNLLHLTVDIREDEVYLNGAAYPAGYFAAEVLNTDYETMETLLTSGSTAAELASALFSAGHDEFLQLLPQTRAAVETVLHSLWEFPPYSLLDMSTEIDVVEKLFHSDALKYLLDAQSPLREFFFRYLRACASIPVGIFRFGWACDYFAEHYLARLRKRDESHFAVAAHDCFNSEDFFAEMASLPIPELEPFTVSPTISSSYVFAGSPKNEKELVFVERIGFETAADFYIYDLFHGLHHGHAPSKCRNCGRYFLTTSAHRPKYCNGNDPEHPKYTCRQIGARQHKSESNEDHPIYALYRTKTATIRKHHERGKIDDATREAALHLAAELRDRALMDRRYAEGDYVADMEPEHIYAAVRKK